jgi:hypothetical protein
VIKSQARSDTAVDGIVRGQYGIPDLPIADGRAALAPSLGMRAGGAARVVPRR